MNYKILRHAAVANNREWEDHKYVAKVPISSSGGVQKYRYFYSDEEYQAYLRNKQTAEDRANALRKANTVPDDNTRTSSKLAEASKELKELLNTAKESKERLAELGYEMKDVNGELKFVRISKENGGTAKATTITSNKIAPSTYDKVMNGLDMLAKLDPHNITKEERDKVDKYFKELQKELREMEHADVCSEEYLEHLSMNEKDELYHYGIKGMKWGVRRAKSKLSKATTKEERDAAISSLNKHRAKATAKVTKLEKKRVQLENRVDKNKKSGNIRAAKLERRAATYEQKSAKARNKAYGAFTSKERAQELLYKSGKLQAKADRLHTKANIYKTNYERNKAMVERNETMAKAFKQGISEIDQTLVSVGREYMKED